MLENAPFEMLTVQTNPTIGDRGLIDSFKPMDAKLAPFVLAIHGGDVYGYRAGETGMSVSSMADVL